VQVNVAQAPTTNNTYNAAPLRITQTSVLFTRYRNLINNIDNKPITRTNNRSNLPSPNLTTFIHESLQGTAPKPWTTPQTQTTSRTALIQEHAVNSIHRHNVDREQLGSAVGARFKTSKTKLTLGLQYTQRLHQHTTTRLQASGKHLTLPSSFIYYFNKKKMEKINLCQQLPILCRFMPKKLNNTKKI
jgi:hypothetical protein